MAEVLVLRFDGGVGPTEYEAVNGKLGIDMKTGKGDWPEGLLSHAGGPADDGSFVVVEIWASRQAQEDFMHSRLGAALAAGGITTAPQVTWASALAYHTLGSAG